MILSMIGCFEILMGGAIRYLIFHTKLVRISFNELRCRLFLDVLRGVKILWDSYKCKTCR